MKIWTMTKNFARKLLSGNAYKQMVNSRDRAAHACGLYTWPTKSYEVWMLLQALLYLIQPNTLIEFGAGRSTFYLSEYAFKFRKKLVSFEQHFYYFIKLNLGLKFSMLPSGFVKHVPVKNGWYDLDAVKKSLRGITNIDFLFYDGPATPSFGDRSAEQFYTHILPLLKEVKFIIVDDVHRAKEDAIAAHLVNTLNLKRYNIDSKSNDTTLALLLDPECDKKIALLPLYIREFLVKAN